MDKNKPPLTDEALLAEAFADVKPLAGQKPLAGMAAPRPQPKPAPTPKTQAEIEAEARALLYRDMAAQQEMQKPADMVVHDHSVQRMAGARPGVDLRKLQRGQLVPEAKIDLHGFTLQQAWIEMGQFLQRAHARGLRCVLVIHGKGNSAASGMGGIKQNIGTWLGLTPIVLGYHSARVEHGGDGALYVLLKRSDGR